MKKNKPSNVDIARMALFSAIIVICSWISVPATIPFTMQAFGVFLTVGVLGGRHGSIAVAVYILLGAVGVPVFSGFSGGVGAILGVRGGYIIGFLLASLVMWASECIFGKSKRALLVSMVFGLLVCYAFGTAWFTAFYAKSGSPVGFLSALAVCVLPYIIPDAVKIALALYLSERLKKAGRGMS